MFGLTFTFFSSLTQCYSQTVVLQPYMTAGGYGRSSRCSEYAYFRSYIRLNTSSYPVSGVFNPEHFDVNLDIESLPNITCAFSFDRMFIYSQNEIESGSLKIEGESNWDCVVPKTMVCDGNTWTRFTERVFAQISYISRGVLKYSCDRLDEITPTGHIETNNSIFIHQICDKIVDCEDLSDENKCPGRFYCDGVDFQWVEESKRCDFTKYCSNGRDECFECNFGSMTSDKFLLKSELLICVTAIFSLLILGLNVREFYKGCCYKPTTNVGKIDKILKLQVNFYDFLMGVYLGSLLNATIFIKVKVGAYCLYDHIWRSDSYCDLLGVIFSVSSQGSLFIISLMSIIRSIICNIDFFDIPVHYVTNCSIVLALFVVSNAIIPIVGLSKIKKMFRTAIVLKNGL